MIGETPSTAGSIIAQHDSDYEPVQNDASPTLKEDGKREFKQWLASTDYQGRWRSTNNYCSLSKHDQTIFRHQMKAIFHHVLHQLAPNDVDTVWDDIVDDETKKPRTTKNGYDKQEIRILFHNECHLRHQFFLPQRL
jgi:hypothetical protein